METNIFKLLKIDHRENLHSQFIVAIIKTDKNAKELFIKMLIDIVKDKAKIHNKYSAYKIVPEKPFFDGENENRVDIFLSDKHGEEDGKTRILIENKIDAGDQPQQLFRYHKYFEKDNIKYDGALFYLTIEGRDASLYSTKDFKTGDSISKSKDYFLLSYHSDIIGWLKKVLEIKSLDVRLRMYIEDYLNVVKDISKRWIALKDNFGKNLDAKSDEEKAFLELKFWQFIEQEIYERKNKEIQRISNQRLFNYDKILNNQKNENPKNLRNYGTIFELKGGRNIRIEVFVKGKDKFKLFISEGTIDNSNKWVCSGKESLNCQTRELKNKGNMKIIAVKIIEDILNHF
jgi:hypothetical protein